MAVLIDGKALAQRIREQTAAEAALLPRKPGLAVVLVGDDPASRTYVTSKERDCAQCGFISREYKYDASVTQEELRSLIARLNADAEIDGILVQLPLPESIDEDAIIEAISVPPGECRAHRHGQACAAAVHPGGDNGDVPRV